ncbi:MAG TPA: CBS domain-containing protein [Planctomycetota bacterium]|jgi:CBS domain-containing protein
MPKNGRELPRRAVPLKIRALTAGELMVPCATAVPQHTRLREALALLIAKGVSAAPVVDDQGHALGVIALKDLLEHRRLSGIPRMLRAEFYERTNLVLAQEDIPVLPPENGDRSEVGQIMSQAVFSVAPDTSAGQVAETMLARGVHRLLVTDDAGTLVGVISAFEILRSLEPG